MKKNIFYVIGLMSGTSLDGVDLAYCVFTYEKENRIYKILNTTTFLYSTEQKQELLLSKQVFGAKLIVTDHTYGCYSGELEFLLQKKLLPRFATLPIT